MVQGVKCSKLNGGMGKSRGSNSGARVEWVWGLGGGMVLWVKERGRGGVVGTRGKI